MLKRRFIILCISVLNALLLLFPAFYLPIWQLSPKGTLFYFVGVCAWVLVSLTVVYWLDHKKTQTY